MPKSTVANQSSSDKAERKKLSQSVEIERKRVLHEIATQKFLVKFGCWTFAVVLLTALAIICFQGFHFLGFSLEGRLMQWIGTCLCIFASMIALVYRAFFRTKK